MVVVVVVVLWRICLVPGSRRARVFGGGGAVLGGERRGGIHAVCVCRVTHYLPEILLKVMKMYVRDPREELHS